MIRKTEELPLSKIPITLDESIMRTVENYTVGFLRIEDGKQGKDLVLLGSGTLVRVNGIPAILTAHHVVEVLPGIAKLGLVYSSRRSYGKIETDGLRYIKIARGTVDSDGPDLGAVILPPPLASSLEAIKSFHNMDRKRMELLNQPPSITGGLWVVQGFIAERTKEEVDFDHKVKRVRFFELCSSGGVIPYTVDHYDYFRLPIEHADHRSVPASYRGTSGGGLWQVPLKRDTPDGEISHATVPILSGVAFYQEATESGQSALRCHGRHSIYADAYEAIKRS